MTDKVYPSAKPPPATAATTGAGTGDRAAPNPKFPPNKAQLYNARRPNYRPQPPPPPQPRRSCWCKCCLWTTALILVIVVLAAIAGGVFYLIFRPHRPSFSINTLHLSRFNLTDTSLTSNFNISVTARNPNSVITFIYDQTTVQFLTGDVDIGDGSVPGFTQGPKNVTSLRSVVSRSRNTVLNIDELSALKSSLRRGKIPIKIQMDTKIQAKIGRIKTGKLGIRVLCNGIKISIPSSNTASFGTTKCKLDPRVKIMRWTI